uniref:Uncharacterized protein n=1 Tax=Utricularia reniformis TaxID=192314 RepID=A0A1Y0B036_9LAMI|nr:hypothetical protein AEK19_MT0487 [Utricularia reniformis]ART30744.1 hypothetical protein AEK19_MT0487 [Utricularia reniformis]
MSGGINSDIRIRSSGQICNLRNCKRLATSIKLPFFHFSR